MHVLSVDLGTSNTVAVLSAHGRPPRVVEVDGSATMPSAVFADEDGGLLVGREAERRARLDPARYEPNPKRRIDEGSLLLGASVVPVTDALAAVLRRVADETARQLDGARPDEVRLTHPAQWGAVRRGVLLGAAHRAGNLGANLLAVPEPVAAAAHFASFPGRGLRPGQALAVYDLGAGTFDCAVVGATATGFVVLAENGLPDLGGLDVDQALAEHLGRQVSTTDPQRWQRLLRPETTADRRAQRALREDVRAAKEALSRHPQTDVPMPEPFADALVTRGELEALIRPSLLRSVELLAATIRAAGTTPQALAGIYLVGGSSRIPLVAGLISEQLRVVPISLDQPETAVALGAHHVPRESMNMRTGEVAPQGQGAQPQSARTTQQIGPPTGPGATRPYPQTGPLPGPQTGPQPARPMTGPQPQQPHHISAYPQHAPRPPARRNTTLLVGAAAVLVVVVLAVVAVVALSGSGLPSASDCAGQTEDDRDDDGYTPCLRQLAGVLADRSECQSSGVGDARLSRFAGMSVGCDLGGDDPRYAVNWTHSLRDAPADEVLAIVADAAEGDRVDAEWAGNGLRGRYVAAQVDDRGVLVFAVSDRRLFGVLTAEGDGEFDANALADYFETSVMPGT